MINCGLGVVTDLNYSFTDCCGNPVTVLNGVLGDIVSFDYDKFYTGLSKLNLPTEYPCPTPTPTPSSDNLPYFSSYSFDLLSSEPYPTPTKSGYFVFKNECQVFTLFDMGLLCEIVSGATSNTISDGILKIQVTGGTSPYTYLWSGGQRTNTLSGILPGFYPVTVVDYYGDYTASTICQMIAFTPTPTQTPTMTLTPSSPPPCSELCLTAIGGPITYGPWQFVCNGNYNGRYLWTYNSEYNIVWSISNQRWEVVQNDLISPVVFENTRIMVSDSSSFLPLTSWSFYGTGSDRYTFNVVQGTCSDVPLIYTLFVQNNNCSNVQNCSGSVIISAQGGIQPYAYSINNGFTYQTSPIFNNLCPGNYTLIVQDSNGTTLSQRVSITSEGNSTTYEVSVQNSGSNTYNPNINTSYQTANFEVTVNPPIPIGTTIYFDLVFNYEIQNQGPWFSDDPDVTANYIVDVQLFKNNDDISSEVVATVPSSSITPRFNCAPSQVKTTYGSFVVSLSMTNGDVINGTVNTQISEDLPVILNGCVSSITSIINVSTNSSEITGCYCCYLIDNSQPIIYGQTLTGYVG